MKSLETLLKLARRDLDTLRRALADQIAMRADIDARVATHDQSIKAEQQHALKDYESARAYGGFAALAIAGKRSLEAEAASCDQEAERLRELIAAAHVEMRKFERLLELRAERKRAEEQKRENAELDEIATIRAGRR